jgi:hypothetical protein
MDGSSFWETVAVATAALSLLSMTEGRGAARHAAVQNSTAAATKRTREYFICFTLLNGMEETNAQRVQRKWWWRGGNIGYSSDMRGTVAAANPSIPAGPEPREERVMRCRQIHQQPPA